MTISLTCIVKCTDITKKMANDNGQAEKTHVKLCMYILWTPHPLSHTFQEQALPEKEKNIIQS